LGTIGLIFKRLILIVVPKRLNRSEETLRAGTSAGLTQLLMERQGGIIRLRGLRLDEEGSAMTARKEAP
jgi:hypothetical protein